MSFKGLLVSVSAVLLVGILSGCSQQAALEQVESEVQSASVAVEQASVQAQPAPSVIESEPLVVGRTGFKTNDQDITAFFIEATNPNDGYEVELPAFRVTLRGEDDSIVAVEEVVYNTILPGERLWFTGSAETLAPVSSMTVDEVTAFDSIPSDASPSLDISNVSIMSDEFGDTIVTGEVQNNGVDDFDAARVDVVFLSGGQPVDCAGGFANMVAAGASVPWEASAYDLAEYDSCEITATKW